MHFWAIYARWAAAWIADLICFYVEPLGVDVEEVSLGPNPITATDAVGLKGGPGCFPKPKERLQITIVSARGLKQERTLTDWIGMSSPFCTMNHVVDGVKSPDKMRTKTKKETLEPFWNETFTITFDGANAANHKIQFKVYDEDNVGVKRVNKQLGVCTLNPKYALNPKP